MDWEETEEERQCGGTKHTVRVSLNFSLNLGCTNCFSFRAYLETFPVGIQKFLMKTSKNWGSTKDTFHCLRRLVIETQIANTYLPPALSNKSQFYSSKQLAQIQSYNAWAPCSKDGLLEISKRNREDWENLSCEKREVCVCCFLILPLWNRLCDWNPIRQRLP